MSVGPAKRGQPSRWHLLRRAVALIWGAARYRVVALLVLEFAVSAAAGGQLLLIRSVVAALGHNSSPSTAVSHAVLPLGLLIGLLFVTATAREVTFAEREYVAELVRGAATASIAAAVIKEPLVRFDEPAFYDRVDRARIHGAFRAFEIVTTTSQLMASLLTSAAIVVALLLIAPLALVPFVFLLVINAPLFRRNVNDQTRSIRGLTPVERLRNYFVSLLTERERAPEVRAYQLGEFFLARYAAVQIRILNELRQVIGRRLRRSLIGEILATAALAAGVAWIAYLFAHGHLGLPAALTVLVGLGQVRSSLTSILIGTASLAQTASFFEDFDQLEQRLRVKQGEGNAPPHLDALRLTDVSFVYPASERPAVRSVSLELRRGEVVALVGENGSGKTTLARIIAGLYQPTSGTATWNGAPYSTYREQLGDAFALVPQDFARYWLTAAENIGVGRVSRLDDLGEIRRAALRSGAAPILEALPEGYDQLLGRPIGGSDLSTGEWQRMALARGLFRNASVVILDEPTASLDARAEQELYERAQELYEDRAVLLISHRMSTVRAASRVYVMADGAIIEDGSHDDLLRANGLYAELYRLQAAAYGGAP